MFCRYQFFWVSLTLFLCVTCSIKGLDEATGGSTLASCLYLHSEVARPWTAVHACQVCMRCARAH
eukprot:1147425-Pelagomonas_calceolata.AAC.4